MKLIVFFWVFVFFGWCYGFGEIYSLNQNGQTHHYLLAEDEVYAEAASFKSSRLLLRRLAEYWPQATVLEEYDEAALIRLPSYQNAKGMMDWQTVHKSTGIEFFPVLYAQDKKGVVRNEKTRFFASAKVVVSLRSRKKAKRLARRFGKASLLSSNAQGNEWILKYQTVWEALKQVEIMQKKDVKAQVMMAHMVSKRLILNDVFYDDLWQLKDQIPLATIPMDMNVEPAWDSVSGVGVGIAIVDDGLDIKHPDLKANIPARREKLNVNFNRRKISFNPKPKRRDIHGTACAGLAAAVGNNAKGVAGVAYDATLVGIRLIAKPFTDEQAAMAMTWRSDRIFIYSSSWGPFDSGQDLLEAAPGPLLQEALKNGVQSGRVGRGSIYIWAGGNGRDVGDNANYDGYANSRYVIAVGAYDKKGEQSYYSESGANLVVVAPSSGDDFNTQGVYTTLAKKRGKHRAYTLFTGTSASAPQVAGVIALMLQKNPNLGWRDVKEILIRTANRDGLIATNEISFDATAGNEKFATNAAGFIFSHSYGAGRVDAGQAVALAAMWTNLATETSQLLTFSNLDIPFSQTNNVVAPFEVSSNENMRVETVLFSIDASGVIRSNLVLELTAPSGMKSVVPYRYQDQNIGLTNWTFSSVRHWGESSQGTWQLRARNLGPNIVTLSPNETETAIVHSVSLQLFGTKK
ncbi:MAG: S8 family serine peptidase [Verrucomicrobiae bacterium]|nr:S8 family serine peptidase [Verrucomicrobiae bacterium]